VLPQNRRGTLLLQGMSGAVTCIATHSSQPLLVICCASYNSLSTSGNNSPGGSLQLWNYELKLLLNLREFSFKLSNRQQFQQQQQSSKSSAKFGDLTM